MAAIVQTLIAAAAASACQPLTQADVGDSTSGGMDATAATGVGGLDSSAATGLDDASQGDSETGDDDGTDDATDASTGSVDPPCRDLDGDGYGEGEGVRRAGLRR